MSEFIFEDIVEPWQAYFLGFLFADGSIGKREVSLKLHYKDEQILSDLKEKLQHGKISYQKGRVSNHHNGEYLSKDSCSLRIYNTKMIKELEKYGMTKKKTFTIRFPFDLKFTNHFIRGYFDGDGCITCIKYKEKKYPRIKIASNDDFIHGLNEYLGMGKIHKQGKISVLYICLKEDVKKFASLIYKDSDICLNRKLEIFKSFNLINA